METGTIARNGVCCRGILQIEEQKSESIRVEELEQASRRWLPHGLSSPADHPHVQVGHTISCAKAAREMMRSRERAVAIIQ